jgi:hypothetical protein
MSPVAADCASADSAPGALLPLAVVDGDADLVVVVGAPVEAPPAEDDELLDEDPQPATTIENASTTAKTESLFMARRLPI